MSREQSARAVVMIRPSRFYPNPETAADNAFQGEETNEELYSLGARQEFDEAVRELRAAGVTVHVFDDDCTPAKPDAVFPNNWFSTHHDGRVVLYPMCMPSRRRERRADLIDGLREFYQVHAIVDYTDFEKQGLYLEGTGSLVLDHEHHLAYVALSGRSHEMPLRKFCADFEYEPVTFTAATPDGRAIYHTNVMLCVGSEFALVGLDTITDAKERELICRKLDSSGKRVIELGHDQIANFAGNALELQTTEGKLLVLSRRAA
ncbi:MAG TPA: arginine deiminase-related protein, partial [Chthoniobacterales bacterium]|nr:arginine deiminase-related protein [Chthoniobacterales bacterium]